MMIKRCSLYDNFDDLTNTTQSNQATRFKFCIFLVKKRLDKHFKTKKKELKKEEERSASKIKAESASCITREEANEARGRR